METTLKKIKKYISEEVGYVKVGGNGCDKDNIVYGCSDDGLIELIYKKFIKNKTMITTKIITIQDLNLNNCKYYTESGKEISEHLKSGNTVLIIELLEATKYASEQKSYCYPVRRTCRIKDNKYSISAHFAHFAYGVPK